MVKKLPANAGDSKTPPVVSKDPLEEGVAAHYSICVWRIPQTDEGITESPVETLEKAIVLHHF